VMIRFLDANDTYITKGSGHPSDMLGAVLAAAESRGASGRDLLLATAAAAPCLPARAAADTDSRPYRAGLAALLLLTAALYWDTPFSADNGQHGWRVTPWIGQGLRFGLPFVGVLGVAASLGATRLALPDRFVALIVSLLSMVGLTNWSLLPAAGIGVLGVAVRYLRARSSRVVLGTALCSLVIAGSVWLRAEREVGRRRLYGGLTEFVDREIDRAEVIGYLLSHRSYLLQGVRIGRPVIQLEAATGTLAEWVASLRHESVGVVAIGPLRPRWRGRPEVSWLAAPGTPFVRVFGRDPLVETVVYRLTAG